MGTFYIFFLRCHAWVSVKNPVFASFGRLEFNRIKCSPICLCFGQYSLCNEPLIELTNPGASGSIFYVTRDDEFIIKTVMHKEAEFLQKLLPGYYMVRPLSSALFCSKT